MSNRIAPKLLAEFIGTFGFVFIGAGTAAVVGEGVGMPGIVAIAFAHGLAIMAFAFAYGSVSGAHRAGGEHADSDGGVHMRAPIESTTWLANLHQLHGFAALVNQELSNV